jgi:hypothetical protein
VREYQQYIDGQWMAGELRASGDADYSAQPAFDGSLILAVSEHRHSI